MGTGSFSLRPSPRSLAATASSLYRMKRHHTNCAHEYTKGHVHLQQDRPRYPYVGVSREPGNSADHALLNKRSLTSHVSRVWRGHHGPPRALVGLLHAVALEAERRGLGLRRLSVCRPEEAGRQSSPHPPARPGAGATSPTRSPMAETRAEAAREAGMEPGELRAVACLWPAAVVRTRNHTAVIAVLENSVYPFAAECSHPHGRLEEGLEVRLPAAQEGGAGGAGIRSSSRPRPPPRRPRGLYGWWRPRAPPRGGV